MCLAGRAQSELMIWNPFPVEFGLEQELRPGSNMFVLSHQCCQHRSPSVPEGFLLMNRNFVISVGLEGQEGLEGWAGWCSSSLLFSLQPALSGAPGFICWSRGFMELGVTGSRAELVDSLKEYSAHQGNPPLLLFPEEAATNGRAGLLRFRYRNGNSHSRGEGIPAAGWLGMALVYCDKMA